VGVKSAVTISVRLVSLIPPSYLLLARVDELTAAITSHLAEVREVTEQLEPDRALSCKTAISVTRVGLMEIHERAHARPLDEPEPE
jgi:hypothetical protein